MTSVLVNVSLKMANVFLLRQYIEKDISLTKELSTLN